MEGHKFVNLSRTLIGTLFTYGQLYNDSTVCVKLHFCTHCGRFMCKEILLKRMKILFHFEFSIEEMNKLATMPVLH